MEYLKDRIGLIREYLGSLSFSTFDLLAGLTSTLILAFVTKIPWIFILLPILLTVRGDLAGVFTGVLTTSLHTGQVEPRFLKNTSYYYGLASAILTLSYSNGILSSVLIYVYMMFNTSIYRSFLDVLFISLNTFMFTASISIIITSFVAFVVARKGLDPDVYVYPIISVINDVLVGILLVSLLTILKPWKPDYFYLTGSTLFFIFTFFIFSMIKKYFREDIFRSTIREAYIVVLLGLFMSTVNGIILGSETDLIVKYPQLLVIYPAFIALLGNQGVVLSSQLTTELHLGLVKASPEILLDREAIGRGAIILFSSVILYVVFSFLACILTLSFDFVLTLRIMSVLIVAGSIIFLIVLYPLSITLSVLIFSKGLNPDNFMNSIITTLSDFAGLLVLVEFSKFLL